jgi:ribonucleoside-diphosphate reductase alpha chain
MIESFRLSPFIDLAAVEAWDAWFRWREHAVLHDVSIEDTWWRVASALAAAESGNEAPAWRLRVMDALASWRLLPDQRVLAQAGTGQAGRSGGTLRAALNAACFVSPGRPPHAAIDLGALSECAALAVRVLDDAAWLAGHVATRLRIGIAGIADALALLGLEYDSDAGRTQAAAVARALAEGCLAGSIALAASRGGCSHDTRKLRARAMRRDAPAELLKDAARHGLRHAQLTAITSQPRLALLANNVADAADPLRGEDHALVIVAPGGRRPLRSSGYALNVLRGGGSGPGDWQDTLEHQSWFAQIAMRAALQTWMDRPIAYPLLATNLPDESQRRAARMLTARHGLGEPAWRMPG